MSFPVSDLFLVEQIPKAGRGVVATQSISRGTRLLKSGPPAAHVIFKDYRKEVCATCFHYDLGRTLPVRQRMQVFCSPACQQQWLATEGEIGVEAWEKLFHALQHLSKSGNDIDLPDRGERPGPAEIEEVWRAAEGRATKGKKRAFFAATVHPGYQDTLAHLLSAITSHHRAPETWHAAVSALAQDPTPYLSLHDLRLHANAYTHLLDFLPTPLHSSCTPELLHLAVSAASHNSFGIRDESDAEYMGYALYHPASYFNHSCAPNVAKSRVGAEWIFTAGRDVAVGEELCITYLGGEERELSLSERRARLQEHWGFTCTCVRCRGEDRPEQVPARQPT